MPTYAFTAITEKGREYTGQEEAMSEVALEMRFRSRGHWLAKVAEARPTFASESGFSRGIPAQVLTEFFFQLSLQLRAGIPLVTALSNDMSDGSHPILRKVLLDLVERVQSGQTLSYALSMHPRSFPPLVVNLIRAGEASGKLSETCNQVRLYLEWYDHLRADVRQALIYPMFILACALLFVVVVFTFLVPRFSKLLVELNIPLPALTQAVLGVSQFFVQNWMSLGVVLVGAVVGFKLAVKVSPSIALWIDQCKLGVPLLGPMWKMVGLSRFSQNLAIMYQAGLPLLDCLDLTRKLTGNLVIEQAVGDLRQAVNEGRQMHTAMTTHPIFSGMLVQMVRVGENTGSLGTALENVAAYYNEVLPRQIKRLFTLLEPIMILFLIGFVGIIALSIFMPIVSLLSVQ